MGIPPQSKHTYQPEFARLLILAAAAASPRGSQESTSGGWARLSPSEDTLPLTLS